MKNLLVLISLMLISSLAANAQRLVIGEKAPSVKISKWLGSAAPSDGSAQFIEFFHTSNKQCAARLSKLNEMAERYKGKLTVIVIAKEDEAKVAPILDAASNSYYCGLDDAGRTFDNFGAQFVPFSVLVDRKGRIIWFGNPASLSDQIIREAL